MLILSVKEKNVYGNVLLYPNNDTAQKFCYLLGKKTLTHNDIDIIVSMGYQLELIKL